MTVLSQAGNKHRSLRAGYAYNIAVTLYEGVTLAGGFKILGAIWRIGYTGVVGKSVVRAVRDNLGDLVDIFIHKKGPGP